MDYVSSTYLISINCFRMLRLMNKKDSGLFGGPESETETSIVENKIVSIQVYINVQNRTSDRII